MKKIFSLMLVLGLMVGVLSIVHAANPDDIELTVTVGGATYSVDIASASQTFGTVNLGDQSSLYIGTAANDGNVPSDWEVKGVDASDGGNSWTLAEEVTDDTYGVMIGTSPADGGASEPTWDPGASPQLVSSITTSQAEMPYANAIPFSGSCALWLRLSMPTTSIGAGTYTFTVSLYAVAP
ncbi:MAG: hypothetical protein JW983_06790 [Elusimicrobia bacterium]|nr:hypothetical protein [Elusimicrobiota bacterium]